MCTELTNQMSSKKRRILVIAATGLVLSIAANTSADQFRSLRTGDYHYKDAKTKRTNWEVRKDDKWIPAERCPGASDDVTISNNHTMVLKKDEVASAQNMTIQKGGSLTAQGTNPVKVILSGNLDVLGKIVTQPIADESSGNIAIVAGGIVQIRGMVKTGNGGTTQLGVGADSGKITIKATRVYKYAKSSIWTGDGGNGFAPWGCNGGNSGGITITGASVPGVGQVTNKGGAIVKIGAPGKPGQGSSGVPSGQPGKPGELTEKGDIIVVSASREWEDRLIEGGRVSFVATSSIVFTDIPKDSIVADSNISISVDEGPLDLRGCLPNSFVAGEAIDIWARQILTDDGVTINDLMEPDANVHWLTLALPILEDNATEVPMNCVLSWVSGAFAATHDVYFGTFFDDVNMASRVDPRGVLVSPGQAGNSFDPAGLLESGITYYWRVDEVNDAHPDKLWKGDVWSFTTGNCILLDDFESYTDDSPNRVFQTWNDGYGYSPDEFFPDGYEGNGSGSMLGYDIWTELTPYTSIMETEIVHSGSQSMPFFYDNTEDVTESVAYRIFEPAVDWSEYEMLSLGVHGDPNNTGGQFFVQVGEGMEVCDAVDLNAPVWQEVMIDLKSLDVDLEAVTSLGIGVDGNDASGLIYIDEIRGIYTPGPVSIAVENFSFELPGTVKQNCWDGGTNDKGTFEDVPGWSSDTMAADSGVETDWGATDGEWTGFLKGADPSAWQLTSHVVGADDIIELKVDAADNWAATVLQISLYYDDNGARVTIASLDAGVIGEVQEFALALNAADAPDAVGKQLGVELNNTSAEGESWVGIDNVRLTLIN